MVLSHGMVARSLCFVGGLQMSGQASQPHAGSAVEIITDEAKVAAAEPLVTIRTGQTGGKTFVVKINQPAGRALLVAVHL